MSQPSDIEIAQQATPQPIGEIGSKLGIPAESLLQYGPHKAKIDYNFLRSKSNEENGS